jgi:hypothetical protein
MTMQLSIWAAAPSGSIACPMSCAQTTRVTRTAPAFRSTAISAMVAT